MIELIVWGILTVIGVVWWFKAIKNDPTYSCERYLRHGCPHVDGLGCDMKTCSIKDVV